MGIAVLGGAGLVGRLKFMVIYFQEITGIMRLLYIMYNREEKKLLWEVLR